MIKIFILKKYFPELIQTYEFIDLLLKCNYGVFTFQNGFFSEVLFEISLKKWTFKQKSWGNYMGIQELQSSGYSRFLYTTKLTVYIKMPHGFITKLLIFFFQFFLNLELLTQ